MVYLVVLIFGTPPLFVPFGILGIILDGSVIMFKFGGEIAAQTHYSVTKSST